MLEFCSFHSGEPEFPNIQFKNSTLPMGEYPCCGETAIRFQPLFQVRISLFVWLRCGLLVGQLLDLQFENNQNFIVPKGTDGCRHRDHKVKVKNPKESEMYLTLMTHR